MFQLCFNFNKIHDSVGKALRTADQDHVTAYSHSLSASFHPGLNPIYIFFQSNIPKDLKDKIYSRCLSEAKLEIMEDFAQQLQKGIAE